MSLVILSVAKDPPQLQEILRLRLRMTILTIMVFFCFITTAHADDFDYTSFARIPIQHEGRIKPMATFALIHLEKFSGKSEIADTTAIAWLAQTMFNPAQSMSQPLFLLKDPDAQAMLGLPTKPDNRYSFAEATEAINTNQKLIQSLLQIPTGELSPGQRAVLELHENTALFAQITLSCTLFLHLSIEPQKGDSTFIDYFHTMPEWQKSLQAIIAKKGTDLNRYTPQETALAEAMHKLTITLHSSEDNTLLRVIPPQWTGSDAWLSPWAIFHSGQGSPQSAELMQLWRQVTTSYQEHNAAHWLEATQALASKMSAAPGVRPKALSLEILYYQWAPLSKSMALYILGFALTLLCISGLRIWSFVRMFTVGTVCAGAFLHALTLATRIYILERPPVGTLYESLLFVSLIAVLFGLFLEWRLRNNLGLLVATLAGSLLLFASQSFSGDDTMSMLIAVLNTNFWLATHVLCITTGYDFGLVAGIIAHIHLIMRCLGRDPDKTRQILRGGYGTALIALLFTSLGTILGGIWADQSWCRFWGWDPKENGALLICLWLIWILHGRISQHFHERGFAVALALLNVVIALSWLGVNLLSTGLHSYGFTDKAALSLALFCAAEFSFAAITYFLIGRKDHAL